MDLYAIKDRRSGNLGRLFYWVEETSVVNDGVVFEIEFTRDSDIPVWVTTDRVRAERIITHRSAWYEAGEGTPIVPPISDPVITSLTIDEGA